MRTKQGKSHFRRRRSRRARAQYDDMLVVVATGLKHRVQRLTPYLNAKSK
jgi:hypothetical protein